MLQSIILFSIMLNSMMESSAVRVKGCAYLDLGALAWSWNEQLKQMILSHALEGRTGAGLFLDCDIVQY